MSCGVTGNTSDSGSEESRFEPWQDNLVNLSMQGYDLSSYSFFRLFLGVMMLESIYEFKGTDPRKVFKNAGFSVNFCLIECFGKLKGLFG